MKRRIGSLLLLLLAFLGVQAQKCPPEWVRYTYGGYMYDIQNETNARNLAETEFKNYLLNIARSNLAKQIKVSVQDMAQLTKSSTDGRTTVNYMSSTRFSTDVDMKLVETKTLYNPTTREGYAIAYIDRVAACNYYKNELMLVLNKINNSLMLADNFVSSGFKNKAREELERSLGYFSTVEEPLLWLNMFGASQSELSDWQREFNVSEQAVKSRLSELQHGTSICIACSADIFGTPYATFGNELKGQLSAEGCSFTDNPSDADWVITVVCKSREYSTVTVGNTRSYFSYVDGHITIDKVITSQRIFEDEVSSKGGHTLGYREAARAGYKDIKQQIGKIIKENIQ